jgi:hypothetical protein
MKKFEERAARLHGGEVSTFATLTHNCGQLWSCGRVCGWVGNHPQHTQSLRPSSCCCGSNRHLLHPRVTFANAKFLFGLHISERRDRYQSNHRIAQAPLQSPRPDARTFNPHIIRSFRPPVASTVIVVHGENGRWPLPHEVRWFDGLSTRATPTPGSKFRPSHRR